MAALLRSIVVAVACLAVTGSTATDDKISAVERLHSDISKVTGVSIRQGGIDTLAAINSLAEAIVDLDRRLKLLESAR